MGLTEKIKEAVQSIIIQVKNQIAESLNLTINIGGQHYHTTFPENTDIDKIQKTQITPAIEKRIEEEVAERLKSYSDKFVSLPEPQANQLIADSTAASASAILQPLVTDTISVKEHVRVQLSKSSEGEE